MTTVLEARPSAVERADADLRDAQQVVRDAHTSRGVLTAKLADAETALAAADRRAVAAVSSPGDDDAIAMGDAATARVRRDALITASALADIKITAAERAVVQSQSVLTQAEAGASFDIVRDTLPDLERTLNDFAAAFKTIDEHFRAGMLKRGTRGSINTPALYLFWQCRRHLLKHCGVDLADGRGISLGDPFSLIDAIEARVSA